MLYSKNILFIAYRFLRSKHQHQSINIMVHICALGIMIATCALALVVSIMTGFEQATYQKMQSIYPDIIIDGDGQIFNQKDIDTFFKQNYHPSIAYYAPERVNQALMTCAENITTPIMITLKGIHPQQEQLVSNIASKIINPTETQLEKIVIKNGIMIGAKLAETLNLKVGDTAYILYTKQPTYSLTIKFNHQPVIVQSIFKTGIEEFDINLVYCSDKFFDVLFPDQGISYVHIKLKPNTKPEPVIDHITQNLNALTYSWKDLYPTLLSALKLEKWAMFLILILIICVASMNIISLIFMYVTQKQRDIVILLCMGMTRSMIRSVFMWISMCITIPASAIGLCIAWGIGTLLQIYPCIKLPDNIYDTQYIPIQLDLPIFCAILIITICISLCASIYATRNIDRLKIVELLKTY